MNGQPVLSGHVPCWKEEKIKFERLDFVLTNFVNFSSNLTSLGFSLFKLTHILPALYAYWEEHKKKML